jgi:hypothetical protein
MRTWIQLENMARNMRRTLLRTPGCVSVYKIYPDVAPEEVTVTTGSFVSISDEFADRVCRAALEAILLELKAQDMYELSRGNR